MSRLVGTAFVFCLAVATADAQVRVDPLARARLLYNQGKYDEAAAAAEEGRRTPDRAASADLIAARAYLEKFRATEHADELAGARERLRRVEAAHLTPAERDELLIGLGQALYFDRAPGAAAEIFESVLTGAGLAVDERERVLDWWASALDEDARSRPGVSPTAAYSRIRARMREELGRHAASATAAYWLPAAARGEGDAQGAWDAVQAAWVRSALVPPERAVRLRDDLDTLVARAIGPGRANAGRQPLAAVMAEWERFKENWELTNFPEAP